AIPRIISSSGTPIFPPNISSSVTMKRLLSLDLHSQITKRDALSVRCRSMDYQSLLLRRSGRPAFLEQTVEQSAQINFVFQLQVPILATGLGADHAGTINDDHLRNPQKFFVSAAEILIDVLFLAVSHGIGQLEI